MDTVPITVRVSKDAKKDVENICRELGMPVSVALNIFINAMRRERGIPNNIAKLPDDDDYVLTEEMLEKSLNDIKMGNYTIHNLKDDWKLVNGD